MQLTKGRGVKRFISFRYPAGLLLCVVVVIFGVLIARPPFALAESTYELYVNRQTNTVNIYRLDSGGNYEPYKVMVCSCGTDNGTPKGTGYISDQYVWRALYGNVYGQYASRFNGSILFHSVPYTTMYDKASLEVDEYNRLGTQASMGCVRLSVADAKWIYDNCGPGTKVVVYESSDPGPLGKPDYTAITTDRSSGWDPTDPDSNNPYTKNVTGVTIVNAAGRTVPVGSGYQMIHRLETSGSIDDLAKPVTWSSSNTAVATVSASGLVSGKSAGRALITVRTFGGQTACCTVYVEPSIDSLLLK